MTTLTAVPTPKQYWLSPPPDKCDTCDGKIASIFFDAATRQGPWANMCPTCHALGPGLGRVGTGRGQKYERQSDGRWLKTAG